MLGVRLETKVMESPHKHSHLIPADVWLKTNPKWPPVLAIQRPFGLGSERCSFSLAATKFTFGSANIDGWFPGIR